MKKIFWLLALIMEKALNRIALQFAQKIKSLVPTP